MTSLLYQFINTEASQKENKNRIQKVNKSRKIRRVTERATPSHSASMPRAKAPLPCCRTISIRLFIIKLQKAQQL